MSLNESNTRELSTPNRFVFSCLTMLALSGVFCIGCSSAPKTLDDIMQIKCEVNRLDAFIKLRDNMEPFSKEQVDLINQALNRFNDTEGISIWFQNTTSGYLASLMGGRYNDKPHPVDGITNLSVLSEMDVGKLELYSCKNIRDYRFLSTMKLRRLKLEHCRGFTDVAVLNGADSLNHVQLEDCGVSDLRPLKLDRLRYLSVATCLELTSLDGLEGMELEVLRASNARRLSDISALRGIKGLKNLNLNNTSVSDLSPIKGHHLESLDLGSCRGVTSIEILESMGTLQKLFLKQANNIPPHQIEAIQSRNSGLKIYR